MQLLNAMVALGNDRNNMLWKNELTPLEVVLLQQLHGADAVTQIEPVSDVKREAYDEIERLKHAYPIHREKVQNLWRDWPGDRFPMRLDQLVGLNPALLRAREASSDYLMPKKTAAA